MTPLDNPTESEIVSLETAYWDAMEKKDGKATAALSGETSLVTGASGVVAIPKSKMGKMTEDGDWQLESYEFENVQVVAPAPDIAIIAYTVRQKGTMGGKPYDLHAADSSTWVRGENGWKCCAHSETKLDASKHQA